MNAADNKKQLSNSMTDLKAKMKESNRYKESMHDSREPYQQAAAHSRSSSTGRASTKTDSVKYTDRMDYKRPNTILDPYVFRQASDTDVNYQIIKKTLNKEIPTPSFNRKNADLNASLSLSSRINAHAHLTPSRTEIGAKKDKLSGASESRLVYLDSKPPSHEVNPLEKLTKPNESNKLQYPPHMVHHSGQPMENHLQYSEQRPPLHSLATMNNQPYAVSANLRHQIPVSIQFYN